MTSKELLYVEDALGHEQFMQKCSKNASSQLQDQNLADYAKELEPTHTKIFNKFLNLLLGGYYGRSRYNGKGTSFN